MTNEQSATDGKKLKVKIGDFGLARQLYSKDYYKVDTDKPMPIRWMSPEALVDGIFTPESDVWSYGILMWEVLTLGIFIIIGHN